MLILAADTASKFTFNATNDNVGMAVVGTIILVTWLAWRKLLPK